MALWYPFLTLVIGYHSAAARIFSLPWCLLPAIYNSTLGYIPAFLAWKRE